MHPMLNIAIQAARNAGKVIVRYVDHVNPNTLSESERNTLIQQVDQVAEEEITAVIQKSYPDHSILTEENGLKAKDENCCWLIDPLDGITNFIHGFPQFAISIALRHYGKLEVAVVYDPLRQELFTATRGEGAQLNSRKIRVSACKKLENALIGTGFPLKQTSHLKPYLNTFETLFPQTAGIRRAGSAVLDLAYVAAGRLDGFWESYLKPCDMAAGLLLIKEAGGIFSDFHGEKNHMENGTLVAGNARISKAILDIVQRSLQE